MMTLPGNTQAIETLTAASKNPLHAYLFLGPAGCGKDEAALAFAHEVLGSANSQDLFIFERTGASLGVDQAREITQIASLSPTSGRLKVIIVKEFHLVDEAAPALLKTIEEASLSTIFVILADFMKPELVTVASRCQVVSFRKPSQDDVHEMLREEGFGCEESDVAAQLADGNFDRARILASDSGALNRVKLWRDSLARLDGTGATRMELVGELLAAIDSGCETLHEIQGKELDRIADDVNHGFSPSTMIKQTEQEHKRAVRKFVEDEISAGFAVILSMARERLSTMDSSSPNAMELVEQVDAIANEIAKSHRLMVFNTSHQNLLSGFFASCEPHSALFKQY